MAAAIAQASINDQQILVVANEYTAVLATRRDGTSSWSGSGRGDFGLKAAAAAKIVADKGALWWSEVDGFPTDVDLAVVTPKLMASTEISNWLAKAESITSTSGRESGASATLLDEFGDEAAWRCQFSGCGKDLIRHGASGTKNKSSYFAHIIAASPKGPRGDKLLSGQRATEVSNYILLCDDCHRLIDKRDPKRFTVALLQKMRETSLSEVRRLLDSLQYPEAIQVVLMGNVTGQATQFTSREAEEAMWERGLKRHHSLTTQYFFENQWTQHNPLTPNYWVSLFSNISGELPLLKKFLHSHGENGKDRLAIFPLHGTSVLVLAGRLFGEAVSAELFQFRRELPALQPGGRWHFEESTPKGINKFTCTEIHGHTSGATEACLIVGLTFDIGGNRLPPAVYQDGAFQMPTLQISSTEPRNQDIIRCEDDLTNASLALGKAVQILQDQWKIKKVHLFIGAPATACFKLGQKLQARHHSSYLCHEASSGRDTVFMPTIEITNDTVIAIGCAETLNIS